MFEICPSAVLVEAIVRDRKVACKRICTFSDTEEKMETCPYCGQKIDPEDEILECSQCGIEKCTRWCIAGRGVACFECEEGGDEDE